MSLLQLYLQKEKNLSGSSSVVIKVTADALKELLNEIMKER